MNRLIYWMPMVMIGVYFLFNHGHYVYLNFTGQDISSELSIKKMISSVGLYLMVAIYYWGHTITDKLDKTE